jgi:hypothetical protein
MLQIKKIIVETTFKPDIKVIRPHYIDPALSPQRRADLIDDGPLVPFSSLSISGGIIDAEAAVRRAIEITANQKTLKAF